ncbi:MAG: choice-of-anchor J domain-containing protein [Bacteroidales bacterium]|nr:choice-of-anchor J domain-containing protein [Bacteroidales bacterium]
MRKKLILFLMLALFGSSSFLWADEQTFGFEDGLPTGWVVLDANNDGYTWCLTSAIPTTWTYYSSSSLDWYRTGTNAICSGSYINGVGALTPNDYLVTTKATLGSSSSFSFWAAATDASYPEEHFGVFVSEDGSTWTSVQEWNLTAKSGGHNGGRESRDGNGAKLGAWYQFTANLASYAGEKFIAIRHFDCNDQYIMCVDDITATNITFSNESLDTGGSGGGGSTSSDIITIGEGTTSNSYLPSYSLYNYSLTQQIYTADEIGIGATTFNSIAFYNSGSTKTRSYDMYLVNTDKETFSSTTDWITVTDADKVFSGSVDMTAGTWTTITLDTPFGYTGGNLAIIMDDNTGSWSGGMSCYVFSAPNQALRIYSDPINYDPSDPSSYTGTLMDVKNQIQIGLPESGGGGDDPGITDPWTPDYDAPLGVIDIVYPQMGQQNVPTPLKLRWSNAENAAQYKVEFGSVYVSLETLVDWTDVEGWNGKLVLADYNITLDPNTRYYWKVYNMNNTGEVEAIGLFTTVFNTPTNVRLTETEIFTDESTIVKWNIVGGAISELPETIIGEGTNTNNYLPTYNLYNYSLTQQIYTGEEIGGAGIINSLSFYPVGSITRNLDIYMVNTDKTSFSGGSDWITVTADDLVYSGNVAMTPNTWTTVNLVNPFTFDGTNLAIVVDDNTGTWTSSIYYNVFSAPAQAIRIYSDDTNYTPSNPAGYSGTVMDVKNQIALNHGAKGIFGDRDLLGCNVYVDSVKVNTEPITEREYELTNLAYMMGEGHAVNVTGIYDIGESNFSNTVYVKVSGYTTVTGVIKDLITEDPIADVLVKLEGKDEFNNTVSYIDTTAADGTYNINNVKVGQYTLKATCGAYEPVKIEDLDIVYAETNELDVIYMHEVYSPVYQVYAEVIDTLNNEMAKVTWSFGNTGGGGSTGGGDTFTVDFEGGLPTGWNVIDANNDGWTWCLTSAIPTTWTYYGSLTLDWYHNGTNAICSGSYINGVGALSPDEYLVSPQVILGNGSTFSFWAAATDASYPADHFGVFVSDNGTSDWTMVQEWTLTAKSGGIDGGRASRDGKGAKLGSWHQFSVDLSAYAGLKYIAIRHFNCTDQYIMCVDDIELSDGSKAAPAYAEACGTHIATAPARAMWDLLGTFQGTSAGQQAVATDGTNIYTASWQATPTGGYTFYQYDMEGNFIEGFDIAGATGIRDLTYDGEYFYGSSGGAQIFILDFTARTLVGTINCSGLTSRHLAYDPERDGFWSGNWETLALYSRTGALLQSGPAPTSAYGSAYYKDDDDVEHLYLFCQPNSDAKVYDFNIATNTISGPVLDFATTPGFSSGIAGGCFIANYGDKLAFYGNVQQSPNLIGIYELAEATSGGEPGGPGTPTGGSQLVTEDHYFNVYRKTVLNQVMPEDSLLVQLIAGEYGMDFSDTTYLDTDWVNLNDGIYEYGVEAVYPWVERSDNNVTGIVWSNQVYKSMDSYMTTTVVSDAGPVTGTVVTFTNLNEEDLVYTATIDSTGIMEVEDFHKGKYVLTVSLNGMTPYLNDEVIPVEGDTLDIWEDPVEFTIVLEEMLAPVSSFVVSHTGFARWTDMMGNNRVPERYHVVLDGIFQGETTDNYMVLNTENLEDGMTYNAGVAVVYTTGMSEFVLADFVYWDCDHVDTQIDTLTGEVELADVTLNWTTGSGTGPTPPPGGGGDSFIVDFESGLPAGWTVIDANNDGYTWCLTSAIPSTWTYYTTSPDWYHNGTNAICSGSYINGVGALTPDEYLVSPQVTLASGSSFSFWAAACDASYPADHFGVFVSDNGTSGWTSVQEWTMTAKTENMGGYNSREGKGAKLGTWYQFTVDLSAYAGQKYIAIRHFNCTDEYIICVDDIELAGGTGPTPPPGGGGDSFSVDFESGLPTGWNVIDANNDGWTWCLTSAIPSTWTYYGSLTLDWYHNGTNAICSGSYINGVGALTPDEYLVSPQVTLGSGSTFSFWAAATDASYPADHFGVFVSDNGTSGWTSVQEWTLTAKSGGNGGRASRDGNGSKLGTWNQFTVDLSAYAGQKYIAIRHFNCTDQYIMCVDDMQLTSGRRDEITVDFEGGLPAGWNVIDGNNDGWTWCLTSAIPSTWTYYASLTLDWYHNGTNAICSGSYINGVGALTPDEYLVSPQMTLGNGASISFWAAATDASYPADHFGVFVSDNGTSGWTSVQEWTLTAKTSALDGGRESRDGNGSKLGTWHQFTADLSAYAGQKYIAIRHFNCTDQYIMCVDDITITTGAGGGGGGGGSTTITTSYTPGQFNILVDGEVVGATTDQTFTYTAEDELEHEYTVIYVDNDYNFSCPVSIVIAADPTSVAEMDVVRSIYPNPTSGDLHINAADMKRISIVNMLGQMVYDRTVEGNETVINMAPFGNGVYMVSIVTENGRSVKRIVVNK